MTLKETKAALEERRGAMARVEAAFARYAESAGAGLPEDVGTLTERIVLEGPAAVRRGLGWEAFDGYVRILAAFAASKALTQEIDRLVLELDALEDPVEPRRSRRRD